MQMKSVEKYRIMGIDPGTNYMGYGVLEIEGRTVRSVVLGDIDLHKLPDPYAKLRYIFERVGALGDERVKGLGGGKKAASKGGSQSWEQFLKKNPDREIK